MNKLGGDDPIPARACTCHPDDNPPVPCAQKYALSECRAAADGRKTIELDIPKDPGLRAIISVMNEGAHKCLRGVQGGCTQAQYNEAHERVMQVMLECYALKINWRSICLAYQGDSKPCATPCLHCARIETALMPKPSDTA